MRTVSYVDHLKLSYHGNLSAKAIALGDVDNDQGNELVVGNIDGEVYIYKGSESKARWKASDLGMITCLEIGDICNHGTNYLVTLSAAGWCCIFSIKPDTSTPPSAQSDGCESVEESHCLKPIHRQQLAANSKTVLFADIDGDGFCELVVGYSDRRVRSYRWKETGDLLGSSDVMPGSPNGRFIPVENWQLAGQIGSMTVNRCWDGSLDLMVSQPGGTFVTLLDTNSRIHRKSEDSQQSKEILIEEPSLVYHPLGSARARNTGVTTEVVGSISRSRHGADTHTPRFSAICTLDGTLTLVDTSEEEDKILWSLYVDHQLFALTKLDVTGNGTEEVVACSWDGQTYIVNLNREVVRFQFGDNVAAFSAGKYAIEGTENIPCLIYVTFDNDIRVYYNIHMSQIGIVNLLKTMEENEGVQPLLECLNCDASNQGEMKQLYHWCLYGKHS